MSVMSSSDDDCIAASADAASITREAAETYASWFQSLADPTRILILHLLAVRGGEMAVGQISTEVGVAQPTTSHHLKLLHQVGFVHRRRAGTTVFYALNIRCLTRFPTAAQTILGQLAIPPGGDAAWMGSADAGTS
jgi:ArsR family transcriptional regulator, arsenate/arsenite/antimonite-responsive transcriptional repressor